MTVPSAQEMSPILLFLFFILFKNSNMKALFLSVISFFVLKIQSTEQNDFRCPPLPIVELPNGKINVLKDKRIRFSCDEGFHLSGPPILRCYEGNWSSSVMPKCRLPVNSCKPPEPISHGHIWGDSWKVGNEILYICDPGYRLLGSQKRECLRSRHWSGIAPFCQEKNEPLTNIAGRIKNQFIDKVNEYSTDSVSRAIGIEIRKIGLEMILLIDRSSSIDPIDFKIGIEFAKFLIDEFGAQHRIDNKFGTRVAFITFGDKAEIVVNVNDERIKHKEDAKNILDSLMPEGGGTAITDALSVIPGRVIPFLRPKAKRVIFLLTDGHNNIGDIPPRVAAKSLRENFDFEIFTVGIGQDINKNELVEIASTPQSNHVFLLNKYSDLSDILWLIRNTAQPTAAPELNKKRCGYLSETKDPKVKEALVNWPWLATVYVKFPSDKDTTKIGICSGSLICNQWILTSASCLYGEDKKNLMRATKNVFITLGEKNLAIHEKTEKNFYAVKVRLHPKFDRQKPGEHDLALLKLNEDVSLEDIYKAICLPEFDLFFNENQRVVMAGWGTKPSETFYGEHFVTSFNIQPTEVNMPIARDFECDKVKIRITDNLFCAGSVANRTCVGNLGSPLVMKNEKTGLYHLIGVLVEKEWCSSQFNVFVRVERYLGWINNVTDSCQNKLY